jgi:hypothetical protein
MLAEEHPEIYHQHSWIRQLGGAHLHTARKAGLKTVLTVHMPTIFCLRGTMMRSGAKSVTAESIRLTVPPAGAADTAHQLSLHERSARCLRR